MTAAPHTAPYAVVIGAGFAGLAAAAVLSNHFGTVFLLDHDDGLDQPYLRKSVPQGAHVHSLLQSGLDALGRLFAGFEATAVAAGAVRLKVRSQWRSFSAGHWMPAVDTGLQVLSLTRPMLDHLMRQRVLAHPAICSVQGKVIGLQTDAIGAVTGVHLQVGASMRILSAALVVDASGRAGQTDRWLAAIGHPAATVQTGQPEMRYVSGLFSRSVKDGPDLAGWLNLANAPASIGAVLAPVEQDRWIATATTRFGAAAPDDETTFRAFLAALPSDQISRLLARERLTERLRSYRIASVRLKRFDLLPQLLPLGYVPIGDSIASYNPLYGHGMSVAGLQAEALQQVLSHCGFAEGWREALRKAYIHRAMAPARQAWMIAQAADIEYPQYDGERSAEVIALNHSLRRAFMLSIRQPRVMAQIDGVLHLLAPLESLDAISVRAPSRGAELPERIAR